MEPGASSNDNDLSIEFKPTTPHFFKIILQETIRNGKIEIPKGFATNYGNELKSPVVFIVPSGATWPVELINSDGKIWLEKGLSEFLEYYSLSHKDLVTFKYNVVIFDQSASEVGYPVEKINSENKEPTVEAQSIQSDSVELIDEDEEPKQRKSKKIIEANSCRYDIEKSVIIGRAEAKYKPQKPFYWVVMQPTYIHGSTHVAIRAPFARKNIHIMSGEIITLKTKTNERTWKVKYYKYQKYQPTMIGVGWKEFVQDNDLSVGDACAFELIDRSDVTFMVTVIHSENHTNEFSSLGQLSAGFAAFAKDNSLQEGDICSFELMNSNTGQIKVSIERNNS